ncbi:MAG: AAA family ATPase [Candidatus Thermoplasmatota archaeon]|nr:AAA family ATPase [Candidatus Thermoplasmatota archaeon]
MKMKRIVVASMERGAGKTSFIVGLSKAMDLKIGYMKPFGERILYRKKRLLDYDSVLVSSLFGLKESPEDLSLGFDHSKLRFMYDSESIEKKLRDVADGIGGKKDVLFIEGGRDLTYGSSLNLDTLSVARALDASLLFVLSGEQDKVIDQVHFLMDYLNTKKVEPIGLVFNKVDDPDDFITTHGDAIEEAGAKVLGVIPYLRDLNFYSMEHISNVLFAKMIAGEKGLKNLVKNIFVGAMSGGRAIESPLFRKEGKLIITSGDRSDLILGALQSDTAGIVLTNNIVPPSNIISKADERNIPLLLVPGDTFRTAKTIDDMERLLARDDDHKIQLLADEIRSRVDADAILK